MWFEAAQQIAIQPLRTRRNPAASAQVEVSGRQGCGNPCRAGISALVVEWPEPAHPATVGCREKAIVRHIVHCFQRGSSRPNQAPYFR
jgi:hypothetical protein